MDCAGKQKGSAARFTNQYPRAVYHYCCSHDLNLALRKSCNVKEVHVMLCSLNGIISPVTSGGSRGATGPCPPPKGSRVKFFLIIV
jgi:hypothetical protein